MNCIKSDDIENYKIKRMSDGVTNSTINRELSCLRRMFNLAIEWGDARKNPVNNVEFLEEPPGRTRYLTSEEIALLLEKCEYHIRAVVITALNTGMRLGEILNLRWNCVFYENVISPYIEISISKTNKKRFIPLNNVMIKLFKELKKSKSEFIFLNKSGLHLKSVRNQFKTALNKAKIVDFKFHDLRHTFASHFVMGGGDLLTLKEILGHSNLEMVTRYAHLAQSHKQKMINNLSLSDKNCHIIHHNEKLAK